MEGGGVAKEALPPSITKLFETNCPFFMSIGMSYDEFWDGDCELAQYYLQAHELRQDRHNQEMYWQGYYNYFAVHRAVVKAFAKNNSVSQSINYLEHPLPRTEEEATKIKQQRELKEYEEAKSHLMKMAKKQ